LKKTNEDASAAGLISPRRQAPEAAVVMDKFGKLLFPDGVPLLGGSEAIGAVAGAEREGSSHHD